MTVENDHGWVTLPGVANFATNEGDPATLRLTGFSKIEIGRAIDRRTCACQTACTRIATQEDLLCDECRETCR